jgi:hypothetical protein
VTTVPDIPVVELPAFDAGGLLDETALTAPASIWAVDVPTRRRLTPVLLAAVGVLAGIAAMALGAAAVFYAASGERGETPSGADVAPPATLESTPDLSAVERRALALLAKPSTERIPFTGGRGLVLAVGSGGRAAILIRGFEPAPAGRPHNAWIVRPEPAAPVRAARFVGTERAVFLTRPVGPRASVVVTSERPILGSADRNRVVAVRG